MVGSKRRGRRAWLAIQLVFGLVMVGGAVGLAVAADTGAAQQPGVSTAPTFGPESADIPGDADYRIRIPDIGVDAPIVAVEIDDDGELGVPNNPLEVGWWSGGPTPGSDHGTSILAGHIGTARSGPGALENLAQLQIGATIEIEGWNGSTTFVVEEIVELPQGSLPASAFDQQIHGRLAIVSCTDLDEPTGTYRHNLIAYARPDNSAS